ncbi:MAG: RNA-binding protein, partial [Gammaproteobacteria bacterium]
MRPWLRGEPLIERRFSPLAGWRRRGGPGRRGGRRRRGRGPGGGGLRGGAGLGGRGPGRRPRGW